MNRTCSFEGCPRKPRAKGLCQPHWKQDRSGGPLTAIDTGRFIPNRNELGQKWCSGCGWKDPSTFGLNSSKPDGLANLCRHCAYSAGLYSKYRITAAQYDDMMSSQGGVCAICSKVNDDGQALAVDHDHSCCPGARSCGACVRMLLCVSCNTGIGSMRDDVTLLRKAIDYLESFSD
jgi:hypothetical protein